MPINALVITSNLVLNGIGGLACGWLFWTFGLESAMLAHFLSDVIMYALDPLITGQDARVARIAATAVVLSGTLLALIWAGRCLLVQRREVHPQMARRTTT